MTQSHVTERAGGWPDSLLITQITAPDVVALVTECGQAMPVDAARWHRPAGLADHSVIQRCLGPVLDIGSAPERMLTALSAQGIPSLGIDVSRAAVERARTTGEQCVLGDIVNPVDRSGDSSGEPQCPA